MKTLILIIILSALSLTAISQTKMIAHKSHSGSLQNFTTDGIHNFGDPPMPMVIDTVKRLSDSTIVRVFHDYWGNNSDTIQNHPFFNDPNIAVDSLQKMFPETTFVGYDTTPPQQQDNQQSQQNNQQQPQEKKAKKKNKKKRNKKEDKSTFFLIPNLPSGGTPLLIIILSISSLIFYNTRKKKKYALVKAKNRK